MLSLKECRAHLQDSSMTDEEVEAVRSALYTLSEQIIRRHCDRMNICNVEHSFTAGCRRSSKRSKGMAWKDKNTDAGHMHIQTATK